MDWLRKLFDNNEKDIQKYRLVVEKVNALEPQIQRLSNAQLRDKTGEFQEKVQSEWGASLEALEHDSEWDVLSDTVKKDRKRKALDDVLDPMLPEVFAVVREAGRRTLGQRHYDVQLIGGIATHDGRISELRTGEGKTLMATLPLYLNALAGRGAHLVTANDYLSKVGAVWMGPIYNLLGMSVGIIQGQSPETGDEGGSYIYDPDYEDPDPRFTYCRSVTRKEAYDCDVTYGTNNEFGFDYLRDNLAFAKEEMVQRDLHFAIVDEVDSILIDEARTPLIISGMVDEDTSLYKQIDRVISGMKMGKDSKDQKERDDPTHDRNNPNIHYLVDEKQKTVAITEPGTTLVERVLGVKNVTEDPKLMHHVTAAMKAHALFKKDIDYVVKDGEIVIVDEFTGRMMFGRRYSDGLHQAIEAKENVEVKHESQTIATITFQNLFRLYLKLAGMTGTAKTEEDEFRKIYGLDVVVVPTNKPMVRKDQPDLIYKSAEHKWRGVAAEILRVYSKQQPVLVGTRSIEMSEKVSSRITYDRLQVLCMVSIIRTAMEATKSVDKATKSTWSETLNGDLDKLSLNKLNPIAKALSINPDPLANENMRRVLEMLDLETNTEHMENLEEVLRHGVPHNILNAKFHEKEAIIIAEAGRRGAVTIATNMAGRGVDILLGGKPTTDEHAAQESSSSSSSSSSSVVEEGSKAEDEAEAEDDHESEPSFRRGGKRSVLDTISTLTPEEYQRNADEVRKLGGLYILGSERHESRRIDNQLRGRSGRQGDPGESRFFVSLEDELMRLFGDRTNNPLLRTWPEDQSMDAPILSKMIQRAQRKVEAMHFESRKHVLQYDDVMNKQREIIYGERRRILEGADLSDTILGFLRQTIVDAITVFCPESEMQQDWDLEELYKGMDEYFPISLYAQPNDLSGKSRPELTEYLTGLIEKAYADKEQEIIEQSQPEVADEDYDPSASMRELERWVALRAINARWMEHLANMDYLREGIGLRGYAQQDPLVIYQKEAFEMFENMQHAIQDEIARFMFHVQLVQEQPRPRQRETFTNLQDGGGTQPRGDGAAKGTVRNPRKIGRNDPCWCGSGKKYKACHYPN